MENLYTGQGVGVEEDGDDDEDEVDGNVSRLILGGGGGGRDYFGREEAGSIATCLFPLCFFFSLGDGGITTFYCFTQGWCRKYTVCQGPCYGYLADTEFVEAFFCTVRQPNDTVLAVGTCTWSSRCSVGGGGFRCDSTCTCCCGKTVKLPSPGSLLKTWRLKPVICATGSERSFSSG